MTAIDGMIENSSKQAQRAIGATPARSGLYRVEPAGHDGTGDPIQRQRGRKPAASGSSRLSAHSSSSTVCIDRDAHATRPATNFCERRDRVVFRSVRPRSGLDGEASAGAPPRRSSTRLTPAWFCARRHSLSGNTRSSGDAEGRTRTPSPEWRVSQTVYSRGRRRQPRDVGVGQTPPPRGHVSASQGRADDVSRFAHHGNWTDGCISGSSQDRGVQEDAQWSGSSRPAPAPCWRRNVEDR